MSGLIFADSLSRLGTESAFVVLARAQQLASQGRNIINLGIGQPDFKTPAHIVEAGIKALRDGHHGYTPANGIAPLREAVAADLHRRHGVEVNPDNVVIVPGGKPTMYFAIMMFGQPGVEIMYPNPGFPIYESVIKYSGAEPVPFALKEEDGFAFSADKLLAQITPRTRLIIINSPANPTGGVTPKSEIDKLVAGLLKHPHVALLSDEIYSQMLYGGRSHLSLLNYPEIRDRLIMLDGWSKTYAMTGWRLGYAVWPDAAVEHVTRLCINDHSCVNAAAQYAGLAALQVMLDKAGISRLSYDFSDGSGMSSYNRVSPRATVQLLRWGGKQPWGAIWRTSLPVGGIDGTLRRRFAGTALQGKLWAKTGTLNATNALSGYLKTASGRELTFAAFANDVPGDKSATAAIDAALQAIAASN